MIDDNRYEDIIASIAAVAAFKVNGVASLSGVAGMEGKAQKKQPKSVIVTMLPGDRVVIDVYVNAFSGVTVPDLAYDLQERIAAEVEKSTKYKVKAVNVNVAGVVFNQ
ncbi:MAG TPA: hypothetical protein DCG79_01885 [Clostridiales bacterium]|nr:hypothetical protein [Clostridiales bacterium]